MTQPFTLQPLLNLAQHQNDTATRTLGQLNQQQHSSQQKLDTLLEYRKDYQTRWQETARNGLSPAGLRNFQEFMNKLDEAIVQQTRMVEQSKLSTQRGRSEFDATQRKLKSFDTLQQRHFEMQSKIAGKAEQKALDEHTGRLVNHRMLNNEDLHK